MNRDTLISLYYDMLRVRMVEETVAELYHEQQMRCPVHLCIGQEAISAGICAGLGKDDFVLSNHRSHGHYLSKGGDLKTMLAEIYGKSTGCSGGKGGSMHLSDLSVNFLGATPIVGGIIPVATGVSFAASMKGEDSVTVVFFGDAASEEGVFTESLNFAALKKLPVVFVCENNFFSVYSPLSCRQPRDRDNLAIAAAYGISGAKGDGNNVLDVYGLAEKAVSYARGGSGPYYLEFDTYRWREHCGPNYDNSLGYRKEEEFLEWRKRCPVESFENKLIKEGVMSAGQAGEFRLKIQREIAEAVEFAARSPFPEVEDMFSDVYAGELN
ncbi:MAG: thiamine pyrophosphate-dependent dehydrogenase E1 component subunit alpha [Nitrospirae bacterium]|nr:thiamine pyrophosphate-dependent dehydrogenase E1 component subunit alpha [Nitrospirota bacterium]